MTHTHARAYPLNKIQTLVTRTGQAVCCTTPDDAGTPFIAEYPSPPAASVTAPFTAAAGAGGADPAVGSTKGCASPPSGAAVPAVGADSALANCCLSLVLPLLTGRCTVAAGGGGGRQGASRAASTPSSCDRSYPTAGFCAGTSKVLLPTAALSLLSAPLTDAGPLLLPTCGADVGVTGAAPP